MMGPAFTLLTRIAAVFALLASADAARCRYSADKLPSKIEKYNHCLSIGFDPSIEGCVKVVRENHKLRRNDNRKCAELEKYLMKCGHTCPVLHAAVHGGWSDYGDWSECSAECDGGTQTRTKQCNNPAPMHGGDDCEGEGEETRDCNTHSCSVDGGWGDWGAWSECGEECGGTQSRSKECNNPAPAHGGADCEGDDMETRDCPCKQLTEVYGMEEHENIAASGTASQINSAYKGFATLAIDGDTNGDFDLGSVTHTRSSGADVFWKLAFEHPVYMDTVVVWGRTDCCERRIDGAMFYIDDMEMGDLQSDQMTDDKEEFEVNGFAKEVLIKGPRGKLSLAEVQVFGKRFEMNNIAEDAMTSDEEVEEGMFVREMSWEDPRHINSIVLNYKKDSSVEGFDGTRVYVGETEVGQVEAQDGKMFYVFGGLEGNHSQVRIEGSESVMNIASVEIYGE